MYVPFPVTSLNSWLLRDLIGSHDESVAKNKSCHVLCWPLLFGVTSPCFCLRLTSFLFYLLGSGQVEEVPMRFMWFFFLWCRSVNFSDLEMLPLVPVRYTRNLFLRAFCTVYLSAFISLYFQAPGKRPCRPAVGTVILYRLELLFLSIFSHLCNLTNF